MAAEKQRIADDDPEVIQSGASPIPTAVAVIGAPAAADDPAQWIRRGVLLAALIIGWLVILFFNRFHLSAPTVFVGLGWLAVVSTCYALWRTGVVVVEDTDEDDSTWGRPIGRRTELEREKKTLLKAIKEAEFDREMGKLSKADAEEMIAVYRVRAIEVIKELDQMEAGSAGTVREQIERELKARLEMAQRSDKAKADAISDASRDKRSKKKGKADKADAEAAAAEANKAAEAADDVEASKAAKADDEKAAPAPGNQEATS